MYCIGIINNEEEKLNLSFKIKIIDLKEFLKLKRNDFYSEIRQITKNLAGKVIEIEEVDRFGQMPVLSLFDYNKNEVIIKINSELAPFLV